MRIYFPIAKVDADKREVWGYASTEARDDQGEIVRREALTVALGDYMKFANIREMHQLSAVGVAKEAGIDDKGLYIGAKIVDDQAWLKVIEGVYKGYSIGGRVTQRDPADYKTITGLVLHEISLVDRPANPEAVFDYWKAAGGPAMSEKRFNPPLQIWACGEPEHQHVTKADSLKCLRYRDLSTAGNAGAELIGAARKAMAQAEEVLGFAPATPDAMPDGEVEYADLGDQQDGRKRYPIDTESHIRAAWDFINRPKNARRYSTDQLSRIKERIIGAWKQKIGKDGSPSAAGGSRAQQELGSAALRRTLSDVGHVARIILDFEWLKDMLATAEAMEGENPLRPKQLEAVSAELCDFLRSLVSEESSGVLDDTELGEQPLAAAASGILAMAAGEAGANLIADLCGGGNWRMQKFTAEILAKAKHAQSDQALFDLARRTVDRCLEVQELSAEQRTCVESARNTLKTAGDEASRDPTPAIGEDSKAVSARPNPRHRRQPGVHASKSVIDTIVMTLTKRNTGHRALIDIAHDCIGTLTAGACCSGVATGARHSIATIARLVEAHGYLVSAGAGCDAVSEDRGDFKEIGRNSWCEPGKAARADDIAKALADERAEKAALMTTLADILPRLDQLRKRVEEIAEMPLPPATIAKGTITISKLQDNGGVDAAISSDEFAAAFARMSREEQTLTLIKASYARPIHPIGLGIAPHREG